MVQAGARRLLRALHCGPLPAHDPDGDPLVPGVQRAAVLPDAGLQRQRGGRRCSTTPSRARMRTRSARRHSRPCTSRSPVGALTAFFALTLSMAFRRRFRGDGVLFYLIMLGLMTPGLPAQPRDTALLAAARQAAGHVDDGSRDEHRVGHPVRVPRHGRRLESLRPAGSRRPRAISAPRASGHSGRSPCRSSGRDSSARSCSVSRSRGTNTIGRAALISSGKLTLPLQIFSLTVGAVIRPDLYALGTATTIFILVVVAIVLIVAAITLRRRKTSRSDRGAGGGGARRGRGDRRLLRPARAGRGRRARGRARHGDRSGRRRLDGRDHRDAPGFRDGQARSGSERRGARGDAGLAGCAARSSSTTSRASRASTCSAISASLSRVACWSIRPAALGVVVTHGTDTMEESVFMIDRLLPARASPPVVLTGAQRGASETDTDGPRNLRDAIRVANLDGVARRGAVDLFRR